MPATVTDTAMRAWVGCLACYSEGRLVGEWVDAEDAAESVDDPDWCLAVHGPAIAAGVPVSDHEEWWVMDHEGLPISGECSPAEATRWADWLSEVVEWQRGAVLAWVGLGSYATDTDGLPILSDFDDAYCGEWDSFREYAENVAEECGYLSTPAEHAHHWAGQAVPNPLLSYIDWDAWARDLSYDYHTAPAPGGGVYVFRCV